MRQQDRLEGRVHNIDEQLAKLESDKTLMKVQLHGHSVCLHTQFEPVSYRSVVIMWICAVIVATLHLCSML